MIFKNFPYTKQIHQKDCGPACLKMIAEYYGKSFDMQQLSNSSKVYRNGTSMLQITKEATKIGLKVEALKITVESINEVKLPVILHWNHNHFVVLFKIDRKIYHIADPSSGILKFSESEFLKHWGNINKDGHHDGVLLSFPPNSQ